MGGLLSLASSRKFWITLATIIGSILAARGMEPEKVSAVVGAIVACGSALVLAIAHEDHGESLAPIAPAAPEPPKP